MEAVVILFLGSWVIMTSSGSALVTTNLRKELDVVKLWLYGAVDAERDVV